MIKMITEKFSFDIDNFVSITNIQTYLKANIRKILLFQCIAFILGGLLSYFYPSEYISEGRISIGYYDGDKYNLASNYLDLYTYELENSNEVEKIIKKKYIKNLFVNKLNNEIVLSVINTDENECQKIAIFIGDEIIALINKVNSNKINSLNYNKNNLLKVKQIYENAFKLNNKDSVIYYYLRADLINIDAKIDEIDKKIESLNNSKIGYISRPKKGNLIFRTGAFFKILSTMIIFFMFTFYLSNKSYFNINENKV